MRKRPTLSKPFPRPVSGLRTVLSSTLLVAWLSQGASITPLGFLPGDPTPLSLGGGISNDGSVIVGASSNANGEFEAFRWTSASGMVGLGFIPGTTSSFGFDASAFGLVIVGTGGFTEGFRWTQATGVAGLGFLDDEPTTDSEARAVSGDGRVIVGVSDIGGASHAIRWIAPGPMEDLGDLPGGGSISRAEGVSENGAVIVGLSSSANGTEAFRWTESEGMVGLGDLPGGEFRSQARDVSDDGSIVVGSATIGDSTSPFGGHEEAFIWKDSTGMVPLGLAPGLGTTIALGVCADGTIVVGEGNVAGDDDTAAFVWRATSGIQLLWDVLLEKGVDPAADGWDSFTSANGISSTGRFVSGSGIRNGRPEAFRVDLEESCISCGLGGDADGDGDPDPQSISFSECPFSTQVSSLDEIPAPPVVTATDSCGRTLPVDFTESIAGEGCNMTMIRKWTATSICCTPAVCSQVIIIQDLVPPVLTCPPDVHLVCGTPEGDALDGGTPTATDNSGKPVTLAHSDVVVLDGCPRIVERTWTATDVCGNASQCTQRLTVLPPGAVTDGGFCLFDKDASAPGRQFRLIFTQDPQSAGCYRLTASNPGQFFLNAFAMGTPGEFKTIDLVLPYPFVTQGSNPLHAFDSASISGAPGAICLVPGTEIPAVVVGGSLPVTLGHHADATSTRLSVQAVVPATGLIYLNLHLDFGLESIGGFQSNPGGDAVACDDAALTRIANDSEFVFGVDGAFFGSDLVRNQNVFKKNPGVAGLVSKGLKGNGVSGAIATLIDSKGIIVGSATSDADGFYAVNYRHQGKAATYALRLVVPDQPARTVDLTLKGNGLVQQDFVLP